MHINRTFHRMTFASRPATDAEKRLLEQSRRISVSGLIYLLFVIALLNGIVAGTLSFALTLLVGEGAEKQIAIAVPVAVIIVTVLLLRGLTTELRRTRRAIEQDIAQGQIEIVSGSADAWYYSHGSHGKSSFEQKREFPVLIADAGDGDRLLLTSQTMFEPSAYNADLESLPEDQPRSNFNGLPAPYGFPSKEFEIEFWPHSGELVAIRPSGDMIEPRSVSVDSLNRIGWHSEAVLCFNGDPGLKDSETREVIPLSESPTQTDRA